MLLNSSVSNAYQTISGSIYQYTAVFCNFPYTINSTNVTQADIFTYEVTAIPRQLVTYTKSVNLTTKVVTFVGPRLDLTVTAAANFNAILVIDTTGFPTILRSLSATFSSVTSGVYRYTITGGQVSNFTESFGGCVISNATNSLSGLTLPSGNINTILTTTNFGTSALNFVIMGKHILAMHQTDNVLSLVANQSAIFKLSDIIVTLSTI
jgi:hypothetical protein